MLQWGRAHGAMGDPGGSGAGGGMRTLSQCEAKLGTSMSPSPAASPGSGQRVLLLEKSIIPVPPGDAGVGCCPTG